MVNTEKAAPKGESLIWRQLLGFLQSRTVRATASLGSTATA
jgi:hypothetical protein